MESAFYRMQGDTLILAIRVLPGARDDAVTGVKDGALRVRLSARAREGRANQALCAFLAERLGTAKSRVEILTGCSGRLKRVAVRGARWRPETLL